MLLPWQPFCQEWFTGEKWSKSANMVEIKTAAIFDWITFSFEIFSDHLFLMAKSKNTYMCHVTKIMTSSASFKWSSKRKMCFLDIWSMFSKTFRYNTTKTGKYVKELLLSFPKVKTESKNSLWFDFYCRFWLGQWSKNYAYFLVKIANISACK